MVTIWPVEVLRAPSLKLMCSPAMKKVFSILLAISTIIPAFSQTAKQGQAKSVVDDGSAIGGMLVSPLIQRLSCQPGRKAEVVFTTENPGRVRETAQAEILPFTMEDWTYKTIYGTDHARDCSKWFTSRTNDLTTEAGQRQELRLKVEVPRGTDGAYWCMLRYTPKPNGSVTKSLAVYEIPIVFIIGKNPKPIVKVATPYLRRANTNAKNSAMMAVLPLNNDSDGFSVLGAVGTLRVRETNRVVADLRIEDRNLMPHTKRELAFVVPNVPDGNYRLEMRTVLGSRTLPPVSSEISITRGTPKLASEMSTLETSPITAQPSSLNFAIPAGGQRTASVRLTNNSNHDMSFEVLPVSVEQSTSGAVGIGTGTLPSGLAVDISGEMSNVKPGQSALARVHIVVPKTAQGDLWFGLSIREASNGKALADAMFATVSVPKTEKPLLALESPVEVRDRARLVAVKYMVRNAGNIALRPEATAAILADGVRLVDRLAVPDAGDGGILPGKVIANSVMLPSNLKPGAYVAEIAYQYGEKDYARLRIPFNVAASAPTAPRKAATATRPR